MFPNPVHPRFLQRCAGPLPRLLDLFIVHLSTLIVVSHNDAWPPPDHTSCADYGLNQHREGMTSYLRYDEFTHAQHFDAFNALPGFDRRVIPLPHYFNQALNTLFAHLTMQAPLPPSQGVHITPRGVDADGSGPLIAAARHLTTLGDTPSPAAVITVSGMPLYIPA